MFVDVNECSDKTSCPGDKNECVNVYGGFICIDVTPGELFYQVPYRVEQLLEIHARYSSLVFRAYVATRKIKNIM